MKIVNLSKNFGENVIYDSFNFTIPQGETSCLLGPSGCGKTTLLNIMAQLSTPDGGEVIVEDHHRDLPMGYVFQEARLLPWLTVLGNLIYPMDRNLSHNERVSRAKEMLHEVELDESENKYPRELSGGMARRVSLARALLIEAPLILMDEPLSSLDSELRERMIQLLKIKLKDRTAVLVTHDNYTARMLSDHIYVLSLPPVQISEIDLTQLDSTLQEIEKEEKG